MDSETTTFLTRMRESIEGRIDSSASESRAAVRRVEQSISSLSREVGEQTAILGAHTAQDEHRFNSLHKDIVQGRDDNKTRLQKAGPALQGSGAAGVLVVIAEWFRSLGGH